MFNLIKTVQRTACSQTLKPQALSICLCIAAMLATMSVCSAQSIEVDELTDAALQIDGTVMYVYGTDLDDWVLVQPHPTQVNHVRVQILDLDDVVLAEHHYSMASLEAIIVLLGAGADTYSHTTTERDIVYGGADDDVITGTAGADVLVGEAGNDTVHGLGGNDFLNGGPGEDHLYGEAGVDQLRGGTERDWLYGDLGNDTLYGDDIMDGGQNNDTLHGGNNGDIMLGGSGNDTLNGGTGNDFLTGDTGTDVLNGNENNDTLIGGTVGPDGSNDTLRGNSGADMFKRAYVGDPPVQEDTFSDFNAGQGDTTIP